jgi:hypothetical protein
MVNADCNPPMEPIPRLETVLEYQRGSLGAM